jgi:hypothetical protein
LIDLVGSDFCGIDGGKAAARQGRYGVTFGMSRGPPNVYANEDEAALFWEAERYRSRAYPWEHLGGVEYELYH